MLLEYLKNSDLTARLNNKGELEVVGLRAHPGPVADELRGFIRSNKAFIVRELQKAAYGNASKNQLVKVDNEQLNSKAETFLSWVQNGHVHLYTDNQGGLYPAKTAPDDWAEKNWSYVQKTWMRCFSEIFKAFEDGKLDRYVRSYCPLKDDTL